MLFRRGLSFVIIFFYIACATLEAIPSESINNFAKIDSLNEVSASLAKYNNSRMLDLALIALSESKKANYLKGLADSNYNIGDYFYYTFLKDSALHYYREAAKYSEMHGDKVRTALCDYSMAYIYFEIDKYEDALHHARKSLTIIEGSEDSATLARILTLICEIYNFRGENDRAIDYCIRSIEIYDQLNNPVGKANALNVVGNIYTQYKIFDKAEKHLREALSLAIKYNHLEQQSVSYSSLAELFHSKSDYDNAWINYKLSYDLDLVEQDTIGLAFSTYSLGKIYLKLDSIDEALDFLHKSLLFTNIVQNNDLLANIYAKLGKAYHMKGRQAQALDYLNKSLAIALEINAMPILQSVYKTIAEYYEKEGYPDTSLKFYKLYMDYDDKMKQEENARKIAEVDAIYELALKEKRIDFLTKENEIQFLKARERELLNNGLFVFIIFTLVVVGILFNRNKIKNKANKELEQQKEAINHQKEEIEQQRDYIQSKSIALAEIHKQVTDSIEYARRIQLSLFPSRNELQLIFPQSFVFNKPKDIISGDFYWVTTIDDKIYLAVVDCTGHGVPGAFMTILASSLLNQIILENRISCPGMTLSLLDIKVKQNLHLNHNSPLIADGMDIGLCVFDKKERTIDFAGAKFCLYYSDGENLCQIIGNRYPIGSMLFPDKIYQSTSIQLPQNTTIFLATDGFQDQFGGDNDTKFMKSNFRKLLKKMMVNSINEQHNILCEKFYSWKGNHPQTDDVLVVGIKI
jgi:serine phosphatase RsbU (regulator of sigma subunit)/lipopolysaccharide biosynthesis regulator YciM